MTDAAPFKGHLPLTADVLERLFVGARSQHRFTAREVSHATLRALYDLARLAPTAFNSQPARFTFLSSAASRERLTPALSSRNREKTLAAPVTAIVAYDVRFHERLPQLWPSADVQSFFTASPELAQQTAERNAFLQAAYFILAGRALGLTAGPMSGFKSELVDAEFFPEGRYRSLLLVNLGYVEPAESPRPPRLEFDQAAQIL